MAAADTARLIASLELQDKFSGPSKKILGSLGRIEGGFNRIGNLAQQGARNAATNIARIGIISAAGIGANVKLGLDSLAELESAITSVDGAISTLGLTGQLTGKQVADWANQIEADIGAAFDDKEITAAASTLLRFGKVTPKNLKPALEVMTDLAVKTGDVESAASLLAKALADPEKAAGKLARVGIILTKEQQKQIKAMTEAGDVAGAQALILDELAKSTEGAAKASQGPYARSLAVLKDVTEDAQKALAIGFLPVIQKVADLLGRELAKPETLANIQKFGEGLAGGLDSLIEIAQRLPWEQIGDSLKLGAAGATAILDAFVSLPPWIQTAVITGWGLNKLTGGALGGIVSELGKGLIKGVLGMNAGVVNINAGTVRGGPGGGGGAGGLGAAAAVATGAGVVILGFTQKAAADLTTQLAGPLAGAVQQNVGGGPVNIFGPFERLMRALNGDLRSPLEMVSGNTGLLIGRFDGLKSLEAQAATRDVIRNERLEAIRGYTAQDVITATNALRSNERQEAIAARAAAGIADTRSETAAVRQAINAKDLSVTVENHNRITTNVSVRETIDGQTTFKQYQRFIS